MKRALAILVVAVGTLRAQGQSPSEVNITQARKAVAEIPNDTTRYKLLANALIRRAQETSDDRFYDQAAVAIDKSLAISPEDFEARKLHVAVLLGEHEFPDALTEAKALNKKVADDVMVYGLLTDAYSELGDYKEAEKSAQWMLNLRPGNLPAFVHAAHLREVFGEVNGSYDALELAYQGTSPTEKADRASLLSQMGRERRLAGNNEVAEQRLKQALSFYPGYTAANQELADIYLNEKRYDEAIALLRQVATALPNAKSLYRLAEALETSGHVEEAKSVYAEFQRQAVVESARKSNANRELVFYYADRAHLPSKALEIATAEHAWRQDIYTLDAYAWALHVNGQDKEACQQMDIALAVGTRDPKILAHAEQLKMPGVAVASGR